MFTMGGAMTPSGLLAGGALPSECVPLCADLRAPQRWHVAILH